MNVVNIIVAPSYVRAALRPPTDVVAHYGVRAAHSRHCDPYMLPTDRPNQLGPGQHEVFTRMTA